MRWVVLGLVAAAYVVWGVVTWVQNLPNGGDTAVYQAGAASLLHGFPLYDNDILPTEPGYARLPFTYPPVAALLFTPLVIVPPQVAWGIMNALSVLALVGVVYVVLRKVPRRPSWLRPEWGAVLLGLGLLLTEPVRVNLGYGQINLLLMALVVLDVLAPTRFGGVLVGVAAAVKLTPLIFVVHFLLVGRKRDALRAAGTFVGLQALMFAIAPHDAYRFWTHTVFDSSRIGPTNWSWNQSLGGMIRRFSEQASWSQPVAYGIGLVLAVGAAVLVRRYRDRPAWAMLVTGYLALLVSPVSWVHHWVWAVPLVAVLLAEAGCGNKVARWLLPVTVLLFTLPILRWIPHGEFREYSWTAFDMIFGNGFVLFPVVAGVVLLVRSSRRTPELAQVG
ncbi:glycosyltransferase 87 family protein [Actinocrispum wychmicini]|uniref:Alpha-1,2-mannosyltransferase n=1 Tax=Actinocrispum wychmicini TaxID=1213861 RepID=A0A4R2K040_9PSEU|nr:glycosyltransferase 87 family protein [Actinocrispum wychmicini]TCO65634.1 alpha-1,2-mannosyltransferase [Actinocrispum wychmicini]